MLVWCGVRRVRGTADDWWLVADGSGSGTRVLAAPRLLLSCGRISGMKAGCCCCPRSRAVFGPPSPWRSRLAGRGDGRPPPPAQPCHHGLSGTRNLCIVVESWNNGNEVPRWGVAEIQKMSPSTTWRCYCFH